MSFFVVMALIVGGYLSATIALAFGGPRRPPRLQRWPWRPCSVRLSPIRLAGPLLGAVPTSKFFALWGLFTLVMMAVAFAAAGLQALLGAAGTLVVVVLFVIFGAPASGGTVPAPYLPGSGASLGRTCLPERARPTVRNTIYFDGNRIATSLIILSAYLVVGAVVVILVLKRRPPSSEEAEIEASGFAAAAVVV